jgi:Ner family transcriptional regulator
MQSHGNYFAHNMARRKESIGAAPSARNAAGWTKEFIICCLHERGITLRGLDRDFGYCPNTIQFALRKPWEKAERIIAKAIGVPPETIWPERYRSRRARASQRKASAR